MSHKEDDLVLATRFADSLRDRHDGIGKPLIGAPFWYSWALIEAYLAGVRAERKSQARRVENLVRSRTRKERMI